MSDKSRLKATVYVGGLDMAVTQETLHAAFIPFGTIADISLPKPELASNRDPHRGFGYVEFEEAEDAKEAIDNMDQSELYGRVIKVAPSKPVKDASEGLGSKNAVWEQVRRFLFMELVDKVLMINRRAIWRNTVVEWRKARNCRMRLPTRCKDSSNSTLLGRSLLDLSLSTLFTSLDG